MEKSPGQGCRTTRRAFVRGTAAAVGGLGAAGLGVDPAAAAATPTVLTRNVYLGLDLKRLFDARSLADVRAIAGDILAEVEPATYEARAGAIAAEIDATAPDVVALQEAALLRTQRPGDFGTDDSTAAGTVLVDLLAMIDAALADRDLEYEIAATTVTTDVELPADTPDGPADVRITDRDVLLVHSDHDTRETATSTYGAAIPFPVPETRKIIQLRRGFCRADTLVDGVPFTVVSTHLESVSGDVRAQQADELLGTLPTTRPVVLCGDFNSGPRTNPETYDRLTGAFDDAYAALQQEGDDATCCQPATLTNDQSRLDRRFDLVLYRGGVQPVDVSLVGHRPEDRVSARRDGEQVQLWPSDHAGVVATLEIPEPTPTPTSTPTPTATPTSTPRPTLTETATPSPTPGGSGPGLGVGAALTGIVGASLAGVRRLVERDD